MFRVSPFTPPKQCCLNVAGQNSARASETRFDNCQGNATPEQTLACKLFIGRPDNQVRTGHRVHHASAVSASIRASPVSMQPLQLARRFFFFGCRLGSVFGTLVAISRTFTVQKWDKSISSHDCMTPSNTALLSGVRHLRGGSRVGGAEGPSVDAMTKVISRPRIF